MTVGSFVRPTRLAEGWPGAILQSDPAAGWEGWALRMSKVAQLWHSCATPVKLFVPTLAWCKLAATRCQPALPALPQLQPTDPSPPRRRSDPGARTSS